MDSLTPSQAKGSVLSNLHQLEKDIADLPTNPSEKDKKVQRIVKNFNATTQILVSRSCVNDPKIFARLEKIKEAVDTHLPSETKKAKGVAQRILSFEAAGSKFNMRMMNMPGERFENRFLNDLVAKATEKLKGKDPLIVHINVSKLASAANIFSQLQYLSDRSTKLSTKDKELEELLLIALFEKVASDEMSLEQLKSLNKSMHDSNWYKDAPNLLYTIEYCKFTNRINNYEEIQRLTLEPLLNAYQRYFCNDDKAFKSSPIQKLFNEFKLKKSKEHQANTEKSRPFHYSKPVFPLLFIPNAIKVSLQNAFESESNNILIQGSSYLVHRVVTICSLATNLVSLVLTGVLRVVANPFRGARKAMQKRMQNSLKELKKTITQDLTIEIRAFLNLFKKNK